MSKNAFHSDYYITEKCRQMWETLVDGRIEIRQNGELKEIVKTHNEAFIYVHNNNTTGRSVPWACVYEGWTVKNVEEPK